MLREKGGRNDTLAEAGEIFLVSLANVRDELLLVLANEFDQSGVASIFVSRSPKNHFSQNGSEVHAFFGEDVNQFAAVGGVVSDVDDAVAFEFTQAVGKDVGGDFFVGREEFFKGAEAAQHHVANDEKRPAVTQHFDGSVERAPGPAVGRRLAGWHERIVANLTCILQVKYS